ncbi:hypothetical protein D9O36_02590 [Zobellia amurskyensis]|uniref:Uncharacterized protein n=1 Tax=Zobellia amurskyensis TaxID=248905 RepID=A0A7X2ZQU7_9FLAO|nr:hypothetical protein [Zobellia amurskyensis]MUH34718.1 hypothetical protein [Zobellia amurskyensis]
MQPSLAKELLFKDKIKWNKLWSSMDVIEDSQIAINDYINLPDFSTNEKGYLYIYGILQALNLQQDSLKNLSRALFEKDINFKEEYPELYVIREKRNNSIGHPTDRMNGKSFHHIGRYSVKKEGFTLFSYFPKTGEKAKIADINILSCIDIQNKLLIKILNKTMNRLKSDLDNHKNKFKAEKLIDLIPRTLSYKFSKLYENIHRDYDLAEVNFNHILETYNNIKKGIIERYSTLTALSGIEFTTERIDYLFERLNRDLIQNKIEDKLELELMIDALKYQFNDLGEMLIEIDEEFK